MPTREEIEAYLDAPDEPSGGAVDAERLAAIEAFLDAPDEGGERPGYGESAYRGAVQGATLRFGDEVQAAIGAGYYGVAKGVRSVLPGGVPEGALGVGEVYERLRDQFRAENAAAQAANPITYGTGEVGGAIAGSGVNPASVVRGLASGGRALLTREGAGAALQAGRSLLTREGARTAAVAGAKATGAGAAFGGAVALGGSEADLLEGEFGQALEDTAEGAETGAKAGIVARVLLGTASAAQAGRAEGAAQRAATARGVEEFDAATAALPEQRAAIAAENKLAREAADAENLAAREQFRTDTAAAKAEAKAATRAKQEAAQAAAAEATRKNALLRTGLEGKQKTLGGAKRAKARAQALVQEPLPAGSKVLEDAGIPADPSRRLVDVADELSPDARLELATGLRREAGAALGAVRDELAKVEGALVPVGPLRAELRGTFGDLPATVQAKALEQLDSMIGTLAKDGALSPAALRKLIEDSEAFANFGTPNLEAALGDARGRVFQAARSALVRNERELIEKALPNRAPEYIETNRRYGIYSDLELGSKVMLERVNKGQAATKAIRPGKVEPVAPREVPKADVREPLLKPEPQAPQFPGGEEALAAGRKLLEPSMTSQAVAEGIRKGARGAGGLLGFKTGVTLTGSPEVGAALAYGGARYLGGKADVIAERWLRWRTPTAGKLSTKAAKLERLAPRFERAIQGGSAAVARLHAQLLAESPDYRAAIAEEDEE